MATKWADYLISAVRYNYDGSHIDQVRSHPDNGATVGAGTEVTRAQVVRLLESGSTFVTITWSPTSNSWNRGAEVRVVTISGEKFIRTDRDATKRDNLGQLPTF